MVELEWLALTHGRRNLVKRFVTDGKAAPPPNEPVVRGDSARGKGPPESSKAAAAISQAQVLREVAMVRRPVTLIRSEHLIPIRSRCLSEGKRFRGKVKPAVKVSVTLPVSLCDSRFKMQQLSAAPCGI